MLWSPFGSQGVFGLVLAGVCGGLTVTVTCSSVASLGPICSSVVRFPIQRPNVAAPSAGELPVRAEARRPAGAAHPQPALPVTNRMEPFLDSF